MCICIVIFSEMQFLSEITLIRRIIALFTSHVPLIGRVGPLLHKIESPFNKEKIVSVCCSFNQDCHS